MSELDSTRLHEILDYNNQTGLFSWKVKPSRRVSAGYPAGTINQRGYVSIMVNKRAYAAHRLAWLYVHGAWPTHNIDHINGVKHDNRIANLRDVPQTHNMANLQRPSCLNKSGFMGVVKAKKRWRALIRVSGKQISLGLFETPEEAHAVYMTAKQKRDRALYQE